MSSDIGPSGAKARNWAWLGALAFLAVGAAAVLYVLFAASSKPQLENAYARLARGQMERLVVLPDPPDMPREALRGQGGASTALPALAGGQVALVNFWATWCAPCMTEMPTLGALARRFEGRGLQVIEVSVDSQAKAEEARAALARLSQGSLDFYYEPTRSVLFSARAGGMPVTILYGRDGRERARLVGGADWSGEDAAALIELALSEP